MGMLTLVIGNKNYSSWSLRPWLALKQTGSEFREIRIPLDTPTTQESLRQYSPSGRVPVLLDGSLVIWESLAICEYLAEQFPAAGLWPTDPLARAIARSVSHEMHSGFRALRQWMPMDCRATLPGQGREPGVQEDIERVTQLWKECRHQFGAGGDFLFGSITIADAMYAPVVSRFLTYGVELDPVCAAYREAIWQWPALQEWVAAAREEVEIISHSKI